MSDTVTISRLDYNMLIEAVSEYIDCLCDGGEAEAAHGPYVLDLEDLLIGLHRENG